MKTRGAPSADETAPPVAAPIRIVRKGRGAVHEQPHRFESVTRERDGDALDHEALLAQEGRVRDGGADDGDSLPPLPTQVTFEQARSMLAYNESPDLGFDRSLNPYRGCEHGCIYCYARPTHSYLNLSPGLDFETKLVAKINAADVLRRELRARGYAAKVVNIGAATDAYQPIEREFKITRAVIDVLARTRHPLTIVTKSSLVERDIDLLAPLAEQMLAMIFVSVTTLDHALARTLEPRAASPARRLRTIETLTRAGIAVDVNFAPVIPFLNEPEMEHVLQAVAAAGARGAHYTVLRLPWEVAPLFREWLAAHYPQRAERIMHRVQDMRGGRDYAADFATRMKGDGLWADLIRQRFDKACARVGLKRDSVSLRTDLFVPPPADPNQPSLF